MAMRLLAVLTLGAAFLTGGCNKLIEDAVKEGFEKSRQEEANKAKKIKDSAADVTATAEEVAKAYSENEVAANQKYKGKVVQVSGTISQISTNFSDKPVVNLSSGMIGPDVACHLVPEDHEKAALLKREQKVTVKGIGEGMMFGASFDPCTITEMPADAGAAAPAPAGEAPAGTAAP